MNLYIIFLNYCVVHKMSEMVTHHKEKYLIHFM